MDIALSLNGDNSSLDVIKYCALYFDHLSLDAPIHFHSLTDIEPTNEMKAGFSVRLLSLYDSQLIPHVKMLKDEGILDINNSVRFSVTDKYNSIAKHFVASEISSEFTPGTVLFKDNKGEKRVIVTGTPKAISNEMIESFANVFPKEKIDELVARELNGHSEVAQFYCLLILYSFMLNDILAYICSGENIVSNSTFINRLIKTIYSDTENINEHKECHIALNTLPILLPNIRDASMEDILEIRLNASDELLELRNYIDNLVQNISSEKFCSLSQQELQQLLNQKINPAIRQLERKMKDIKISAVQKFIKNMANPMYYAPMLTSLFTNISVHQTLLMSLGLITADSIMEHCKNKNSIKNDALYFSIKLRDMY